MLSKNANRVKRLEKKARVATDTDSNVAQMLLQTFHVDVNDLSTSQHNVTTLMQHLRQRYEQNTLPHDQTVAERSVPSGDPVSD